jgi:CDGSH-type Zn-finger protein
MKVKITKNGPYSVDGEIPVKEVISVGLRDGSVLEYKEEKEHEKTDTAKFLCRCGRSKNKPFCDGTHAKIGFDGTETDSRALYDDEAEYVRGPVYDAMDSEKLCASARFCDRGDGFWNAFENAHDPEYRKYAEEVGCKCSSGRFTLVDKNTGDKLEPKLEKEVYLVNDVPARHLGPIHLKGEIQVIGEDGFEYEVRNRVTLCRCGESFNKPFCDGTHLRCRHMET